jgi:hypothetical protein
MMQVRMMMIKVIDILNIPCPLKEVVGYWILDLIFHLI